MLVRTLQAPLDPSDSNKNRMAETRVLTGHDISEANMHEETLPARVVGMGSDQVVIRRAGDSDAVGMADVWLRSSTTALPTVQRRHDDAEVREWFASVVVPAQWPAVVDIPDQRAGATFL
ncbi:hypothetical protein [Spirillospora sp. NPDC048824]|uniref:hypothetical protein n=1 Tax=Spirillospora sp. NPDC048824 TaxID=3364526 RepID=UPI00371BD77C